MKRPKLNLALTAFFIVALFAAGCSSKGSTPPPDTSPSDVPGDVSVDVDQQDVHSDVHEDTHASDVTNDAGSSTPDFFSWDALPEQYLPAFADLALGWHEFIPGGDTTCSRGSTYAFLFRKGTENKILINFEGGGACWNQFTCSVADAIFKDNVQSTHDGYVAGYAEGIFDHENEAHPFKDWHHLYIPYCTGDIHIGNASVTYGEGENAFDIEHKGSVNAQAALDWLYSNVTNPDKVFVTGCSAGAYGSAFWTPRITEEYSDATVYQMGDSGCGVITDSFLKDSFPIWSAEQNLPGWIDGLDPAEVELTDLTIAEYYILVANHYSNQFFSQFTTLYDNNQAFYFSAMGGGDDSDWSLVMRQYILEILEGTSNFRVFMGPGDKHCIIPYPEFFTIEVGGRLLTDWLKDVVSDQEVENHLCEDCDLSPPPEPTDVSDSDVVTSDAAQTDSTATDTTMGDQGASDPGAPAADVPATDAGSD